MTTDPQQLAHKMYNYIAKTGEVTYETLISRGLSHGVPMFILEASISLLHKDNRLEARSLRGDICYRVVVKKTPTPLSHLVWIRENYPPDPPTCEVCGNIYGCSACIPFYEPGDEDLRKIFMTREEYKEAQKYGINP